MAEDLGVDAQLSDDDSEDFSQQLEESDSDDISLGAETESDDEREPRPPIAQMLMGALHPHVVGWPLGNRHRPLNSNDGLVDHLVRNGALHTQSIAQVMKACPRDYFIPGGTRDHPDVFADSPLHVTNKGFNISAPHMHATCLQALDLKPGHKVLDVGSGSGLLSAYAAMLVGKSGSVLGVDCLKPATLLAKQNVRRLKRSSRAFAERAGPCTFRTHNIFMPAVEFQDDWQGIYVRPSPNTEGRFDRIVTGASCPQSRVRWLVSLLRPSGGVLISPVIPSELHRVVKAPDGSYVTEVISQVRFSNLELPRDVKVLKALADLDKRTAMRPPASNSTFAADVSCISGSLSSPMASSSLGSDRTAFARSMSAEAPKPASWRRVTKLFTACSSGSERSSIDESSADGSDSPDAALNPEDLGPYDCTLVGADWCLRAHKSVLKTRGELFRAQCASGMRDAAAAEVNVPEHFTKAAVEAFLSYCYTDALSGCASAEEVAACLAVAVYFGAPHLAQLCEISLADELAVATERTSRLAPSLLALADDLGLPFLQTRALDFIADHHGSVAATDAFKALSKQQTDLVAARACARLRRLQSLVNRMQGERANPYDLIAQ